MKSWKPISFPCPAKRPREISRLGRCFVAAALVLGASITTYAKDASLTAVVLFDGPQGAAYVQITEAGLNGNVEVRSCDGVSRLDKNTYNGLPRASLSGASSLQRGANGVLTLTANGKSVCVVPSNLKFERSVELTPATAAEQALIRGTPVSSSPRDATIPEFKPGVKLVFIAAPDAELADFLRAQRANSVSDWEDFLTRHPSSARRASAQDAIAGFHGMAAEAAFAQYRSSSGAKTQDIATLRQAYSEAQTASQSSPGYKPAARLMDDVTRELDSLARADQTRLQAYRKALQDHTPGYSQLAAAKQHVDRLLEARPDYAPLLSLQREIVAEQRKLESTVVNAQVLMAESHYDQAVNSLGPYVAFAPEMPRLDTVISSAFNYHYDNGQKLAARQDWEKAIPEFDKAAALRPDRKDVREAAADAAAQIEAQRNQQAVNTAILDSDEYARKNQFVEAYNVLADLPEKQRALATSQLAALAHNFLGAAVKRAQKIQESHVPIKNPADQTAALEAYVLWDRASSLGDDPAITLKRDFLSAKISAYYLDQANRYLQKPSGAGVGWLYLKQALRYGITNLDSLKDEMARYEPIYQHQSQLSVGIVFRDQTSRRDSHGFADQLADAISSGLDSSGMPIAVIRNSSETDEAQHPNFTLVGQVLEHRMVKNPRLEAPESKYRAGTHEKKNPAWLQIESDYESAQQKLTSAQHALADAQAQHKKKQVIADATDSLQKAQKSVDELKHKLDATEQSRVETVVESYHYTRKTIDLTASTEIEFQFRDRAGNLVGQPATVRKEKHTTTVVLQDVKAEDTEGITNQGVEPDGAQLLTDLEIDSRNELVKAAREKAAELPAAVLQAAKTLAQQGDTDGAAELYVLYLNATPQGASPGRDEAVKFLRDQFNLAVSADTKL
jgi:tetratricopeptide (TPR) repeat protein